MQSLLKQYPTVSKGIGNLIGVEVMFHIDPEVSPVAQKPRQIPFHLGKKVEQELLALKQQNIIEKEMDQLRGFLLLSSSQRRMVMRVCVWTCIW